MYLLYPASSKNSATCSSHYELTQKGGSCLGLETKRLSACTDQTQANAMMVLWFSHKNPIEPSQPYVMVTTLHLGRAKGVEVSRNIKKMEFHISVVRK